MYLFLFQIISAIMGDLATKIDLVETGDKPEGGALAGNTGSDS